MTTKGYKQTKEHTDKIVQKTTGLKRTEEHIRKGIITRFNKI